MNTDEKYIKIREEYENTAISYNALAKKYGVGASTVSKRGRTEGWKRKEFKTIKEKNEKDVISDVLELYAGNFNEVDTVLIMAYSDSIKSFLELKEDVSKEGKFILSPKGTRYMNPKYSAMQMEKMNLLKFAKELSLTPKARKELGLKLASLETSPLLTFDSLYD